jgi:hypothetical protein
MFNLPFPTDSLYKFCFMFGLALIVFSFYFKDSQLNKFDSKQAIRVTDSLKAAEFYNTSNYEYDAKVLGFADSIVSTVQHQEFMKIVNSFLKSKLQRKGGTHFFDTYKNNFINRDRLISMLKNWGETYLTGKFIKRSQQDSTVKNMYFDILRNNEKDDFSGIQRKILLLRTQIKVVYSLKDYQLLKAINLNEEKISDSKFYYWSMIIIGFLLFVGGTVLWYFLIQKPQDRLLKFQLKQVEKQNIKLNTEFLDWQKAQEKSSVVFYGRKHFEPKILLRPEARNLR